MRTFRQLAEAEVLAMIEAAEHALADSAPSDCAGLSGLGSVNVYTAVRSAVLAQWQREPTSPRSLRTECRDGVVSETVVDYRLIAAPTSELLAELAVREHWVEEAIHLLSDEDIVEEARQRGYDLITHDAAKDNDGGQTS